MEHIAKRVERSKRFLGIPLTVAAASALLLAGCSFPTVTAHYPEDSAGDVADIDGEGTLTAPEAGEDTVAPGTDEHAGADAGAEGDLGGASEEDLAAAFAEREQFMKDQQLPLDGSLLSAITPEQKQFVAEQRAHAESQGAPWTPETESLVLALTADACETAILSHHDVSAVSVQMHIVSSPLFQMVIPAETSGEARTQAEASMTDIMVYGMQHMCPADFPQWRDAAMELYPDYFGSRQ